jgi:hypothetical protein
MKRAASIEYREFADGVEQAEEALDTLIGTSEAQMAPEILDLLSYLQSQARMAGVGAAWIVIQRLRNREAPEIAVSAIRKFREICDAMLQTAEGAHLVAVLQRRDRGQA